MKRLNYSHFKSSQPFQLLRTRLIVVLCFIFFNSWGQEQNKLEIEKIAVQKEIRKAEKLLEQTNKAKEISLEQLFLIEEKIIDRQELIENFGKQIKVMSRQINENHEIISSLESDIKSYKAEYVQILREAAKRDGSYDKLMFIMSADNFNQAYKRMKYLQQYSSYRKNQVELIKRTQETLNKRVEELELSRSNKIDLIESQKEERLNLSSEKKDKEVKLSGLQSKERILKQEIGKKKKAEARLKKAIKEAIAKAVKETQKLGLTPKAKEIMGKFENNKNKLRWPVDRGVITSYFGKYRHPDLNIEINNNGIDLATEPDNKAKAVFDGVVSKIIIIPNAGKAVLVRHGEYRTVYFKIKKSLVEPGQEIKMGDELGTIITNNQKGTTVLHFELWKGNNLLNPMDWLIPK